VTISTAFLASGVEMIQVMDTLFNALIVTIANQVENVALVHIMEAR
jgi:hypothetical protein